MQKRWFHATTKENWKKIKTDGLRAGSYLSRSIEEIDILLKCDVLLSVKHLPDGDDYCERIGELVVKSPILREDLKVQRYL